MRALRRPGAAPVPPRWVGGAWGALALLALLAVPGCAPEGPDCHSLGQLCTVAGTGQSGYNGDGQAGTASWLYWPSGLDFDLEGRLVLVDFNNVRVRRLEAGRLITIAGSGIHGWSAPGAKVLDSPLENPIDVAFAEDGTWYIAAFHEFRVLKVENGTVSPYAGSGEQGFAGDGGPAEDAALSELAGIETGANGELYIADTSNHCLRMVGADGVIQTLGGFGIPSYAGDGGPVEAAFFNSPGRLHRDGSWLYVADTGNHLVRRLDLDTGRIEAFAGRGVAGYEGDGGPANEAALTSPYGVAVGPDGRVFIADAGAHVVRVVELDGTIGTFAGTGEDAMALDRDDDAVPATEAALAFPMDVAADAEALYIADALDAQVRRVSLGGPEASRWR